MADVALEVREHGAILDYYIISDLREINRISVTLERLHPEEVAAYPGWAEERMKIQARLERWAPGVHP